MKFLLDTHLLLLAAGESERLSRVARDLLENPENELFFSPASLWEIIIKQALDRPDFRVDARLLRRGMLANDYQELEITSEHIMAVGACPYTEFF